MKHMEHYDLTLIAVSHMSLGCKHAVNQILEKIRMQIL